MICFILAIIVFPLIGILAESSSYALGVMGVGFDKIIELSSNIRDYTIREKTAMVLAGLKDSSKMIDSIKNKLKNDENFYVRRYSQAF